MKVRLASFAFLLSISAQAQSNERIMICQLTSGPVQELAIYKINGSLVLKELLMTGGTAQRDLPAPEWTSQMIRLHDDGGRLFVLKKDGNIWRADSTATHIIPAHCVK